MMTPEEEAADFKRMVAYFWLEKGDPTRFTGWSEATCARVWPEFLLLWRQHQAFELALNTLAREHRE